MLMAVGRTLARTRRIEVRSARIARTRHQCSSGAVLPSVRRALGLDPVIYERLRHGGVSVLRSQMLCFQTLPSSGSSPSVAMRALTRRRSLASTADEFLPCKSPGHPCGAALGSPQLFGLEAYNYDSTGAANSPRGRPNPGSMAGQGPGLSLLLRLPTSSGRTFCSKPVPPVRRGSTHTLFRIVFEFCCFGELNCGIA
jgi:hypothetical protein